MRLHLTVTHRLGPSGSAAGPTAVDVEVDATSGCTAAELAAALVDHLRTADGAVDRAPDDEPPVLVVAGGVVAPDTRVGRPPLLDGAAVVLHRRDPFSHSRSGQTTRRRSAVVLAVVHGPDCGRVVDLPPGVLTVGRSADAGLHLDDAGLSRVHAELHVGADGVTVRDLGSTNGTRVDDEPVGGEPVLVTTANVVRLGSTVLALRPVGAVPAATTAVGDGTLRVNRRPRILEPARTTTVTLPSPPQQPRPSRLPWVAVLLPIPVAGVLAAVVGPMMLAFALMGPVLMVGTALGDRWGSRRTYAAELVAYGARLREAHERVDAACRDELRSLSRASPDPARVLAIATGPTERLWERRRSEPDALTVAIGRCRHAASVQVARPASDEPAPPPQLHDAPCRLALGAVGVLGLCGDTGTVVPVARSLLGQLVTLTSPADLRIVCLLDGAEAAQRWHWLLRIPHCRSGSEPVPDRFAVLDHDEQTLLAVAATLAATVRHRSAELRGGPWDGPTTVVLVDGAASFRAVPDLAVVLAEGPRVGVLCIAVASDRGQLPHEAGAVLELGRDTVPVLSLPGHHHADLVVDGVGAGWCERLSRALAPLRDATPPDGPAALPVRAGLQDCGTPLDDRHPTSDDATPTTWDEQSAGARLARTWRERPHATTVPLGVCSTGTFSIDLAADGPHVLVGGTTGAGKSELLRTLVASLALHNSPQHLSFVLVDYKGGAAFRDCADLPHVAGVVTDLDDQLAARALTSLTAEVTRRERLLRDAGVTDLVAYQSVQASAIAPLPRLVVVVDEFRALAEELPAFVDGLVHLAALGRSLGIHLVLATQRPAGVVTADIKANVNLRIALRMRDRIDSEDVVDSPSAAHLDPSTPGRAQARVGGSPLVEFQAAHVGTPLRVPHARRLRVRTVGSPVPTSWLPAPAVQERRELDLVVCATREAAALEGLDAAPAAWLPPLPAHLPFGSLEQPADDLVTPLGLVDVPEEQRQTPFLLDLRSRGHWAVVGGPGSGRSTALLTIARSLCSRRPPDSLHVYAVSGGSLAALTALPQVGATIDWGDTARVERLVARLAVEVAQRRAGGAEPDPTPPPPPPILLLVDDWDLVVGRPDDLALAAVVDRLLGVLREGEAVGLTAVLAGDRSLLLGRAAAVASQRIVLQLADPSDAILLGLAPRAVAALRHPGRGLTPEGRLVQLALPPDPPVDLPPDPPRDPSSPGDRRRPGPWRVDALPSVVHPHDLLTGAADANAVAVGIGGDDSSVLQLHPEQDGRRWLVAGPAGSGVSTALLHIAASLLTSGRPLAVVAPRAGPLDRLRLEPGVAAWCDGTAPAELVQARRRHPSLAVVVDAADELLDGPLEPVLQEVGRLVDRDGGLLVVGANATRLSSMYRGIALDVARHRTGILLAPRSSPEGDVLGVRVSVDRAARPGRGHLVRGGVALPLQVAFPSAEGPSATAALPRSPVDGGGGSVTA